MSDTVVTAAGTPVAATGETKTPVPASPGIEAPAEKPQPLAEILRAEREARVGRQREAERAKGIEAERDEWKAKATRVSKADIVSDPIGFAEAHGLSKEEMMLVGQSYLYHFVPEKAPQDLAGKLLEAKIRRENTARDKQAAEEAQKRQAQYEAEQVNQYAGAVSTALESFKPGTYPESEAWFGGSQDEYHQSLMHTANNMALAASKLGQRVDLRPETVAAELEKHLSSRFQRRDTSRAEREKQVVATKPVDPASKAETFSTRGQSAGAPRGPALTDDDRRKRAIEAAFPTR